MHGWKNQSKFEGKIRKRAINRQFEPIDRRIFGSITPTSLKGMLVPSEGQLLSSIGDRGEQAHSD